jgi:putative addiction module component (TIGR02574 family)
MPTATPSLDQLLDTILALPASDRAVIADAVMDSLDPPDPQVEQAVLKLARQRLADYDSGKEAAIPVEDVLKELDEMFKEVNCR